MNKKPDPKFLDTLSGVEPTETDKSDSKDFENRLAKLKAEDEHGRDRITLEVVAWCVRGLIVLVFVIIWVAVFALGWHTLLPENPASRKVLVDAFGQLSLAISRAVRESQELHA